MLGRVHWKFGWHLKNKLLVVQKNTDFVLAMSDFSQQSKITSKTYGGGNVVSLTEKPHFVS